MAFAPKMGMMLIPDISGYTEFLNEVELTHASYVVTELLRTLVAETRLNLTLSEIEGDALLFYRHGAPPALDQVIEQAARWMDVFQRRLYQLERDTFCSCGACGRLGKLRLKVIGHFGVIGLHRIGPLTKIIGKDVVLAHRLLKNTVTLSEYLYLSWPLYEACGRPGDEYGRVMPREEQYPVFGKVATALIDLAPVREAIAPPPSRAEIPRQEVNIHGEVSVRCTVERAAAVLADPMRRAEWMEGLTELNFDPRQSLRAGQRHGCTVAGRRLNHSLHDVVRKDGTFRIAFVIGSRRLTLKAWYALFEAKPSDQCACVAMTFAYTPRRGLGWIARILIEPPLRRFIERSLDNLKALLERESILTLPSIDTPFAGKPALSSAASGL